MPILPFPLTGPAGRLEALRHLFRHGYAEADSDLHHVARTCLVEAPTPEWCAVGLSNGGGYLFPRTPPRWNWSTRKISCMCTLAPMPQAWP